MEFCAQSWNFVLSHGILPILLPNCAKFDFFFVATIKKLSSVLGSPHFLTFSAKTCEANVGMKYGHGKSRNGHGKVTEKYFFKSVGTLINYTALTAIKCHTHFSLRNSAAPVAASKVGLQTLCYGYHTQEERVFLPRGQAGSSTQGRGSGVGV